MRFGVVHVFHLPPCSSFFSLWTLPHFTCARLQQQQQQQQSTAAYIGNDDPNSTYGDEQYRLKGSVVIDAPCELVFRVLMGIEKRANWDPHFRAGRVIETIEAVNPAALTVGHSLIGRSNTTFTIEDDDEEEDKDPDDEDTMETMRTKVPSMPLQIRSDGIELLDYGTDVVQYSTTNLGYLHPRDFCVLRHWRKQLQILTSVNQDSPNGRIPHANNRMADSIAEGSESQQTASTQTNATPSVSPRPDDLLAEEFTSPPRPRTTIENYAVSERSVIHRFSSTSSARHAGVIRGIVVGGGWTARTLVNPFQMTSSAAFSSCMLAASSRRTMRISNCTLLTTILDVRFNGFACFFSPEQHNAIAVSMVAARLAGIREFIHQVLFLDPRIDNLLASTDFFCPELNLPMALSKKKKAIMAPRSKPRARSIPHVSITAEFATERPPLPRAGTAPFTQAAAPQEQRVVRLIYQC